MVAAANLVEVAALVGDTARATILAALMGGQALTGSELAFLARISRPEIWRRCLALGWFSRERESRALRLTPAGRVGLFDVFGVDLSNDGRMRPARHDVTAAKVLPA